MSTIPSISLPSDTAAARAVRPQNAVAPVSAGGNPAPVSSQSAQERADSRIQRGDSAAAAAAAASAPEVRASEGAAGITRAEAQDLQDPRALQSRLDSLVAKLDTALQFRVDDAAERMVVSVLDAEGEVLLQIPSEVALRIAKSLATTGRGLVNDRA
ncbi:MAG TPA: flagellar protein FlaG [Arenimonas sp.]|nr:flagellar protein FlaG [Arenimonas sp.]